MDATGILILLVIVGIALLAVLFIDARRMSRRVDEIERHLMQLQRESLPGTAEHVRPTTAPRAAPVLEPQPKVTAPALEPESDAGFTMPATVPQPEFKSAAPSATSYYAPVAARGLDLESVIGSRWLVVVGVSILLIAGALFLTYAFQNNWIGPNGRIIIGLLAGSALLYYGQRLYERHWTLMSEGITVLATGILYLTFFASWAYYHILAPPFAATGMLAVTAALILVAIGRSSQRLAVLALAGGYITPLLLHSNEDQHVALFSYLVVLNGALYWLAVSRNWRALTLSCVFTIAYSLSWYATYYDETKLWSTLPLATILYFEFLALPALMARWSGFVTADTAVLAIINTVWYAVVLYALIYQEHPWWTTAAFLGLAALQLALAQLRGTDDHKAYSGGGQLSSTVLFAGIAIALTTVAVPLRVHGYWIAMAWSVEGAFLIYAGLSSRLQGLRTAGLLIFVLSFISLVIESPPGGALFANPRFDTMAVMTACFAFAVYQAAHFSSEVTETEQTVFTVLQVATNIFVLVALSLETTDWASRVEIANGVALASLQQLSLSCLWTLYASVLIVVGLARNLAIVRWEALILYAVVVIKVLTVDMSSLALGYRILSFVVVGLMLLVAAFLYQRRLRVQRTEKAS